MKQYYAVTTKMIFEKTILVPVECAKDIKDAMEMVDAGVEIASVDLLNGEAEYKIIPCAYADNDGIYTLSEKDAAGYQVLKRDTYTAFTYKNLSDDEEGDMAFTVPKEWAEEWCRKNGYSSRKEFNINYTWDESADMFKDAENEEVLLFVSKNRKNHNPGRSTADVTIIPTPETSYGIDDKYIIKDTTSHVLYKNVKQDDLKSIIEKNNYSVVSGEKYI